MNGSRSDPVQLTVDGVLLAGVGVLAVHQISYSVAGIFNNGPTSAHGHLALAWMLSSGAAVLGLARGVTASLRKRRHAPSFAWLALPIMSGYAMLEIVERLAGGLSAASLTTEPAFWLGLAIAPLVAFGLQIATRTIEDLLTGVLSGATSPPASQRVACIYPASLEYAWDHNELSWSISRRGPPFMLLTI